MYKTDYESPVYQLLATSHWLLFVVSSDELNSCTSALSLVFKCEKELTTSTVIPISSDKLLTPNVCQ